MVKRIYQLTLDGKGPYQICCLLKEEKVPTPGYYAAQKGLGFHKNRVFKDPYNWQISTLMDILRRKEYLGHTYNFKTTKHFKDRRSRFVDESEWVVIKNTHEPIIDLETFDNVQRIRAGIKRRPDAWGYTHPLSGLMFCADCGGKLYVHRIVNGKDMPTYVCSNYSKSKSKLQTSVHCGSGHRILAANVMELIGETLKAVADYARIDKKSFEKSVKDALASQQTSEVKTQQKRLNQCNKRHAELDRLLNKIYEDYALSKLPEKRYEALSQTYGKEQDALEKEINELISAVERYDDCNGRAKRFIDLVNRYTDFTEINVSMLNEFVEKIVVHERGRKNKINSSQRLEIHLNFIGEFIPPQLATPIQLTPEQLEEQRLTEERREKFSQNYLKRKASGKQKEYYERNEPRRKANTEAKRKALFESMPSVKTIDLVHVSLSESK